jgi:carboxyvinyl-carboxyphosphonate phosphorylmutase
MTGFRELLAGPEPVLAPGAYDALSARLVERAGFPAVYMTGFGASASLLGRPDVGLLSFAEMADHARRIVQAVGVPVIADADDGYGNPLNVMRTVREYAAAGVAALHVEDQVAPKRCGHMEGKEVIDAGEMVEKVRAAVEARGDTELLIIARTDARAVAGLDEAIRRGRAFVEHGASAVFVEAPESVDEMARVRAALAADVPLVANMVEQGKTPVRAAAELAGSGYRLVLVPVAPLLAAAHALRALFATLARDGATGGLAERMLRFDELNGLVGLDEKYRRERDWLR